MVLSCESKPQSFTGDFTQISMIFSYDTHQKWAGGIGDAICIRVSWKYWNIHMWCRCGQYCHTGHPSRSGQTRGTYKIVDWNAEIKIVMNIEALLE